MVTLNDLLKCDSYEDLLTQIKTNRTVFNIDNYNKPNIEYAMHCNTEEKANIFCKYLDSVGERWGNGKRYTDITNYDVNLEDTVYYFIDGTFGSLDWALSYDDVTVLEFDDFDWE